MMVVMVSKPEAVPIKARVPVVVGIVVVVVVVVTIRPDVSAVAIPVALPPMAMAPVAIVDRIDLAIRGRHILLQTADRRSACRNCYHRREQHRRSEGTKLRSCRHGISLHLTPAIR